MSDDGYEELTSLLKTLPPGPVDSKETPKLTTLLMRCWDQFSGGRDKKMEERKLVRLENPSWEPPVLTFEIERHAPTMGGSMHADVQEWTVDVEARTAIPFTSRKRAVRARAKSLDTAPLAAQVVEMVVAGKEHPWLTWTNDKQHVQINLDQVIPPSGPKETVQGRHDRLERDLDKLMAATQWRLGNAGTGHTYQVRLTGPSHRVAPRYNPARRRRNFS